MFQVGTGNTVSETRELNEKLRPHLREKKPDWVVATKDPKATPHLWIDDPRFSVVFTVKGDIRLIKSKVCLLISPLLLLF